MDDEDEQPEDRSGTEDLAWFVLRVLFWPYLWWRAHNRYSNLGTSPDEDEAERFWLKFALYGCVVAGIGFALYYFLHHWSAVPAT